MNDYYTVEKCREILQVESGASEKEIKKAYAKLVRQYPPEKDPEGFKEIRKAYEKLMKVAKTDNIQESEGEEIVIDPYLFYGREISDYKINSTSNFKMLLTLAWSFCEDNNYSKAIEVLKAGINHTTKDSSLNLIYFMELLEISAGIRDYDNFAKNLDTFFDYMNIDKDTELSDIIIGKLKYFSYELTQDRNFTCAQILLDKILEIVPYSYEMEARLKPLVKIKKCQESIEKINNSNKISAGIKEVISVLLDEEKNADKTKLAL